MSRNCSQKNSPRRRRGRRGLNGLVEMSRLASVNIHSPGDLGVPAVQKLSSLVVPRRGRVRGLRFANVLLALALALAVTSTAFADSGASAVAGDTGPLIDALRTLAKVVVDTLIAVAAILMVVGVATGFVAGQLMTTLGAPYGASTAMMRVVTVVLLAIGAFLTTIIANTVIDAVAGMVPATEIRVPAPGGGESGYLEHLLPVAHAWTESWLAVGNPPV